MIKTTPLRLILGGVLIVFFCTPVILGAITGERTLLLLIRNGTLALFALAFALGWIFGPSEGDDKSVWKDLWQNGFNYNTASAWTLGLFASIKTEDRDIDRRMAARRARVRAARKRGTKKD